jgi:hypothetical protein
VSTSCAQLRRQLLRDNPGLVIELGGRHWKLKLNGRLVGILPSKLAKEGISRNLATQFRKAGVRI